MTTDTITLPSGVKLGVEIIDRRTLGLHIQGGPVRRFTFEYAYQARDARDLLPLADSLRDWITVTGAKEM